MTTAALFQQLLEEVLPLRNTDFSENHLSYDHLSVMRWVRKNIAPGDRPVVYKDFLLLLIDRLVAERDQVRSAIGTQPIPWHRLHQMMDERHGLCHLLGHLQPLAVDALDEQELAKVVRAWMDPTTILVKDRWNVEVQEQDLNEEFFAWWLLPRLLMAYQRKHRIPEAVLAPLQAKRDAGFLQNSSIFQEELDRILRNEPPEEVPAEKRTLSATTLTTDKKKWKFLQDHSLGFVAKREDFHALLESLSQVDYKDHFCVTAEMRAVMAGFDKAQYEAFVLDVHADSCADGGKRSPWFVSERAVAYQIFVWILFELQTPNRYSILTKIAEKCFTKISGSGATSRQVGDVVLKLLSESETVQGMITLLKLKSRNKYPVFLEALQVAIAVATRYSGLDPVAMEDYMVSDGGLVEGVVRQPFGDYVSEIRVTGYDAVELTWTKDGLPLKTEPAAVKNSFAAALKVWKSHFNDLKKELSGLRMRIENFWRGQKSWEFEVWKQYFFDHPLAQHVVRPLIWRFERDGQTQDALWLDGRWVDPARQPIGDPSGSVVTLWHPSAASVAEVVAWRTMLLELEIRQPFKQAYREVYLVTEAEVATATYSNRFAGHVLQHHKFVALAQQRLWKYSVSHLYSGEWPSLELPAHDVACSFELSGDTQYATTGAVHFRGLSGHQALRMEAVPSLVFSESMRDIDLFVSVCTIGLAEQWEEVQHQGYWSGYSTDALTEVAKTRREVIQALLPKMRIHDRCTVTDKYLVVQGAVRTYKIHFGSGNILMEPNDEYLCIIPDRGKGLEPPVFLPFEGDATLSLVLSKAILLAADDQIKDQVILRQIHRA